MHQQPHGLSTLELMIAFAIAILIIVATVQINFGAQYWVVASQTANEGLYKAKTKIEDLRAVATASFELASSTVAVRDTSDTACQSGGLCYYISAVVSDLSPCSKFATAESDWRVEGYPTTTVTIATNLTNAGEIVSLGGDCILNQPFNQSDSLAVSAPVGSVTGATGLDVLDGTAYVSGTASPHLTLLQSSGAVATNFSDNASANAVDVARDETTGRIYAYLARAVGTMPAGQLSIVDITQPDTVSSTTYALPTAVLDGWRLAFYDRKIYILTKYDIGNPELFIVDVSSPDSPSAYGSSFDLGTTANALIVRDRQYQGAKHRFIYLADDLDGGEVTVLDYATFNGTPTKFSFDLPDTGCGLANKPDARALFLAGTTLYVGREYSPSCPSLPNLYALNVSDPHAPSIISSQAVGATVSSIKASGSLLFLGVSGAGSRVQVRNSDPSNMNAPVDYSLSSLIEQGIDLDGTTLYALAGSALRLITSP